MMEAQTKLRPFEDLIKPIEYDGKTFVPIEEIAKLALSYLKEVVVRTSTLDSRIVCFLETSTFRHTMIIFKGYDILMFANGYHQNIKVENQVQIVKNLIKWGFVEP